MSAGYVPRPALPTRLFRLELRRNAMWLMLPLIAVLMWFASPYGRVMKAPLVLWSSRSLAMQGSLQVIGPFVAGVAAWMASRDSRRKITDLVRTTAWLAWRRQLTTWAATTAWAVGFYGLATAVLFLLTARQASWGGPVWWPVAVGAMGVLGFSALGFALGTFIPGRFTAPLLGTGLLLALQLDLLADAHHNPYAVLAPVRDSLVAGASLFFGADPSLAIMQIIFLSGVSALALGALALPAGASGGRWVRGAGVAITLAGIAASVTGVILAGTARETAQGVVIPALHNGASSRPVGYTAACDNQGLVPVCAQPAYRRILPAVSADVAPVLRQVAGVPGAPVRIGIQPPAYGQASASLSGSPPELYLGSFINSEGPMTRAELADGLMESAALAIAGGTVAGGTVANGGQGNPAQQAISLGMLLVAGVHPAGRREVDAQPRAAAERFAALAASRRREWLGAHLVALRAGHVTLAQLP
jgi:hypothetical protein